MKLCLHCSKAFESINWHCPNCGWQPERSGTVPVFAPELAQNNSGFKASYFGPLAELEASHFWFRARNALIIWALGKYGARVSSFMEIGCGTGFVLQGIARNFPKIHLVGSEIYPEGLAFAVDRIEGGEFMQMDARQIPFVAEFDAIGAFDLLEHVAEDETVLKQMHQALKPGGLLLLTAPQHRWLWSSVDEYSCHIRRYTAQELHDKVVLAGFTIMRSTSFVISLLPFMLISRLLQRNKSESFVPQAESQIHPLLNRIFEGFLRLELWLIRMGVSFPFGGSRLVVATKIEKTGTND
ncbi:MAG: class I SAM-dependent methyltransferase [Proteobacteria bacterium]|nr:class I SAM-dependent methyltransferase [Pseudomonadota bacterium]